jgi:hypothetical protein
MATFYTAADMGKVVHNAAELKSSEPISINKNYVSNTQKATKFRAEKGLAAGKYTYIVRLSDQPIAMYDGSVQGLSATTPSIAKKGLAQKLAKSKKSAQQRITLRS